MYCREIRPRQDPRIRISWRFGKRRTATFRSSKKRNENTPSCSERVRIELIELKKARVKSPTVHTDEGPKMVWRADTKTHWRMAKRLGEWCRAASRISFWWRFMCRHCSRSFQGALGGQFRSLLTPIPYCLIGERQAAIPPTKRSEHQCHKSVQIEAERIRTNQDAVCVRG